MYHQVRLALTRPQIHKVMKGGNIQVAHHKVGHGHVFHLTTMQHNKLRRHHAAGKGMRMHFDHKQIHHHMRHGGGFFDFLKGAARVIARPALGALLNAGTALLPGVAAKVANFAGNKAIDFAGKKLGFGLHRRRRRVGMGVRKRRVGCGRRRTHRRRMGGSFATIGHHP